MTSETTQNSKAREAEEWLARQSDGGPDITLSVIVPAYNEEWRLPAALVDIIDILDHEVPSYEVIVVDDGSRDNTSEVVRKFERIRPSVRLIRSPRNQGKGYSVRLGMLSAKGSRVMFADADGATPMTEVKRLIAAIDEGADVAIGSRALRSEETEIEARWHRVIIGRTFNTLVNFLLVPGIRDTQCGFKMFTAAAARFIFSRQTCDGFSFDVELLHIANRAGMKIREVPVNWAHVSGSKVNLVLDSLRMFLDIFRIAGRHRGVLPQQFRARTP